MQWNGLAFWNFIKGVIIFWSISWAACMFFFVNKLEHLPLNMLKHIRVVWSITPPPQWRKLANYYTQVRSNIDKRQVGLSGNYVLRRNLWEI